MTNFLRILLCTACIITTVKSEARSTETEPTPTPTATTQLDPATTAQSDLLFKNYYKIKLDQDPSLSKLSFIDYLSQTTLHIRQSFYSLLEWRRGSRSSVDVEPYDRPVHFGRWVNDFRDKTCYNTRVKVLIRDSATPVQFAPDNRCAVQSGTWNDPYTGQVMTNPLTLQIDHVVPLKNAYLSGGHKWSFKARCFYANYLGTDVHLIPVHAFENSSKGDRGPDRYMPPDKTYACEYVKNWMMIKALWGLEMNEPEALAIGEIISTAGCRESQFKITAAELERQRRFAQDNSYLCDNIQSGDVP